MTGLNRDRLLTKIRALLSKTVTNGCTEAEAMAALAHAQAMMDAYEVTEDDLALAKEQRATIETYDGRDSHGIARNLAAIVGKLYDCTGYIGEARAIRFVGLPSDVEMARWLLDTLSEFVRRELASYLLRCGLPKGRRRSAIHSFVIGACIRITERIQDLIRQSKAKRTSNSTALVVVKDAAITEALAAAGVHLRDHDRRTSPRDAFAYFAGARAGDRAQFSQGVHGGQRRLGR